MFCPFSHRADDQRKMHWNFYIKNSSTGKQSYINYVFTNKILMGMSSKIDFIVIILDMRIHKCKHEVFNNRLISLLKNIYYLCIHKRFHHYYICGSDYFKKTEYT